jgi:hypothetical protein
MEKRTVKKILALIITAMLASTPAAAQNIEDGFRALTSHRITISGTSSASTASALTSGTRKVRLTSTAAAFVAVGVSPLTATTDDIYLPANVPLVLDAGQGEYVAAIRVSSSGVVYVTEMTK